MKLLTEYIKSLKNPNTEEPFNHLFFRPLGFILAKVLTRTPITPNGVTAIAMLFGIAAGLFYMQGEPSTASIAGLLYLIATLLDCTDGQLARIKGVSSVFGRILDGLCDYVTGIAIYVGMAVGYSEVFFTAPVWWGLILLAGLSHVLQSALTDTYRSRFIKWTSGQTQSLKDEHATFIENNHSTKMFDRLINRLYSMYLHLNMKMSPSESRTRKTMDHRELIRKNKPLVRAWSVIGPSTRVSIAVIASFLNRPDIFFLAVLIPLNLYMLILYLLQARLDSKEKE
jgi:hypothetical protein